MSCGTKRRQLDAVVSQAGDRSRHGWPIQNQTSPVGRFDGQSSVVGANPRRPEPADFLEMK
jgi:hypothetical protein